ncbi:glycoside hydrolase family 3 N-terminal domain-containing protein [Vibrio alfacsensis]|uniref:glycoside hydrolase family 3 N-terminal domain-containing protein n=1 Tax=Vibrio alfacsensis TaxID=1074311 RepID=UPI0040688517
MFANKQTFLSLCVSAVLLSGCEITLLPSESETTLPASLPYLSDWQPVNSVIKSDPVIEEEITRIVALMTLEEKVGQMVQPDLRDVTPEEAYQYKLGSILNGGGAFPSGNKYASASDWTKEADKFWLALERAYSDRGFRIPFMWATDAVHGHNNVFNATVFPHNIGLGATRNPELIEQIGRATAREVAATGLDWTFAPTVATPRDYRWGRVYEGYSEDPEIVYQYAGRMVAGIQGGADGLKSDTHVISNVKHWIGDGGTLGGVDHGQNRYSEEYLRNIHAMGYIAGLHAGAQVVMASFNSWWNPNNYDPMVYGADRIAPQNAYMNNQKIHGSQYLITDVLKGKMGFDGIVVTDWNGQGEINGCTAANCPQAVLAGNDVFMITAREDWQAFYHNVIAQVHSGLIPISRIDDAVTRILRVKMRANLWQKPKPSERSLAGNEAILSAPEHVAIARQAVSESLVLLKNYQHILPLDNASKYLVVGSAANDITKQTGGWSLTWQGDGNTIEKDFPNAQTLLMAMKQEVGSDNVFTDPAQTSPEDAIALVVIGEDPYAEMFGDIGRTQTLEYAALKPSYAQDLNTIKSLKAQGYQVVTVFFSGRPLYVNEEINHSDAFVAAWLPGTEGLGITDVLFANNNADFKGKLSYSWGAKKCSTTINRAAPNIADYQTPVDGITGDVIEQTLEGEHAPLFPYGYGLNYAGHTDVPARFADLKALPLDPRMHGCGMDEPDSHIAQLPLEIFGKDAKGEFVTRLSGAANEWQSLPVSKGETSIGSLSTTGINYDGMQQSALNVVFNGKQGRYAELAPAQIYMQTPNEKGADYNRYLNANATLEFDVRMHSPAPESLILAAHCEWPCRGEIPLDKVLPEPSEQWSTIKLPLNCLMKAGMSFQTMSTPFLLFSEEAVTFDLGKVRYVPNPEGIPSDALACETVLQP